MIYILLVFHRTLEIIIIILKINKLSNDEHPLPTWQQWTLQWEPIIGQATTNPIIGNCYRLSNNESSTG